MSDLRIPIGIFFALVGAILAATGILSDYRAPLETGNLNLFAGVIILIFGGVMLWLGRRSA